MHSQLERRDRRDYASNAAAHPSHPDYRHHNHQHQTASLAYSVPSLAYPAPFMPGAPCSAPSIPISSPAHSAHAVHHSSHQHQQYQYRLTPTNTPHRPRHNSLTSSHVPFIAPHLAPQQSQQYLLTPPSTPYRPRHNSLTRLTPRPHNTSKKATAIRLRPEQAPADPYFKYSKCTGRRKALCIGINYAGQPHELLGCINDAKNVHKFLIDRYRYRLEDTVLLTDDARHPRSMPTRANIIDAMNWLVKDARKHDSLFFHFSGHGAQVPDLDGDEVDGFDEIIFPVDHKTQGYILDDLLHSIMVKPLPAGCRLTAVFDSCHSGTALDLPYLYSSNGHLREIHADSRGQISKASPADVISWSGCQDSERSADVYRHGVAVGAMSHAFMTCLKDSPNQTYKQLIKSIRDLLVKKYGQKPQLSSSHRIDTNLKFTM